MTSVVDSVRLAGAGSGSVLPNVESDRSAAPLRVTRSGAARTAGNN